MKYTFQSVDVQIYVTFELHEVTGRIFEEFCEFVAQAAIGNSLEDITYYKFPSRRRVSFF